MKLLQIHTFYTSYLANFYNTHPDLANQLFDQQMNALIQDGFGALHMFAPYLKELGYDAQLIVANCSQAQFQWHKEQGTPPISSENWMMDIVRHQVETLKPDILYLSDPITFDSRFVQTLSWRPMLVIGWRAAAIPLGTDWSEFDLILTSWTGCWKMAPQLGAKVAEYFLPGFPNFIADAVESVSPEWDVVFSGQWTHEHQWRNRMLQAIAKAPLGLGGEFSIGFFLAAEKPDELPPGIAMHNYGAKWGMEMYRALKKGNIVVNASIDIVNGEGPNMRLFETTGCGAFLLTEHNHNITQFFEPDVEIATFKNEQELIEKIYYYLEHPEEREAIARRGQERCLRDYSMSIRAKEFDAIIQRHLQQKTELLAQVQTLSDQLEKSLADKRRLRRQNKQLRQTLNEANGAIAAMESSKFWKLRQQWTNFKQALKPDIAATFSSLNHSEISAIKPGLAISQHLHNETRVHSPLTGSSEVTLLETIDAQQYIQDWKDSFQIDITEELHQHEKIYLYECDRTKLKFFMPPEITGSENLYKQLEKFDWYYMPDKWEYQVALKDLKEASTVLEIGSGRGYFVKLATEQGLKIRGIELNREAVAIAQQQGLAVESIALETIAREYSESFDAVCSFQVLEHVPNPKDFIQQSIQLLKSNGKLILCVPNSESFLKHQYCLLDMPPHHMLQWSKASFKALESIFPIKLEKVIYEPLASYHVKGYLYSYSDYFRTQKPLGKLFFNQRTLPLYEKLLTAGLNRFLTGQSLYVQFRKR